MVRKSPKTRLDRDAWLREGLNALYGHGIDCVKVEVLSRRLGVTKGSFYWHFKDRDDLLRAMLDYWKVTQLGFVQRMDDAPHAGPESRLEALMAFIHSKDSRHDAGIRAWALVNQSAASAVRAVDRKRIAFVERGFSQLGFDPFESKLRARTLYFYQVGEHTSTIRDGAKLRAKFAHRRFEWLVNANG